MSARLSRLAPLLVVACLVVGAQLLLGALGLQQYLVQLTMAAWYGLATLGLCLFMGYAGQVSLGHAGFVVIGGYSSAVLSTLNLLPVAAAPVVQWVVRWGLAASATDSFGGSVLRLAPWIGLTAGLALSALVAVLVGLPSLRLRGHYLAMATLSLGIIISRVILGTPALGQADGISSVPGLGLVAGLVVSGKRGLRIENYYIAWGAALVGLALILNLDRSRTGRALRAIHGDEEAASALGVSVGRAKLGAFVAAALYASLAGSMLTHYNGGIGPGEASVMKSVRYLALVAAGGMGNAAGALGVSVVLTFLSLRGAFGLYDDAVFAAILVAIMLFSPDGLFRALGSLAARARPARRP